MLSAKLRVASAAHTLEELTLALQVDPTGGYSTGDPGSFANAPRRTHSSWEFRLEVGLRSHAGTEGLSAALEKLGPRLSDELARLAGAGCSVSLNVVQEMTATDEQTTGLHLSRSAVEWLSRAKMEIDVDQYVTD